MLTLPLMSRCLRSQGVRLARRSVCRAGPAKDQDPTLKIDPLKSAVGGRISLGARIRGLNLSEPIPEKTAEVVFDQLMTNGGLLCVDAGDISRGDFVRFSRIFGELQRSPASEFSAAGADGGQDDADAAFVWDISNDGALGTSELEWHSDMSYAKMPPAYSLLYAAEVPEDGEPHTCFAALGGHALEAFPRNLIRDIAGKTIIHDGTYTSDGHLRQGGSPVTDVANNPQGTPHPAIRVIAETDEMALFLGRRRNAYIVDSPSIEDSDKLLDDLWAAVVGKSNDHQYVHKWRPGEIMIWDNRQLVHRRDAFDSERRRLMWRTQIEGQEVKTMGAERLKWYKFALGAAV